jgi:AcrR family transcriptional regulator
MPPSVDVFGVETDEGKGRLVLAAVTAFAVKGFHGTTTRDIAAAAGMSPAALYIHYRSKEELLYAISLAGHERILRIVTDSTSASADPVTQLTTLMHAYVIEHARGHTIARVVNYELAALQPEHLGEIVAIRRATAEQMRALIAGGVESGVFTTPDSRMTALALLSLGIDVARWYRETGTWTPGQVADHYCELALRMVGVPVGAAEFAG